MRSVAVTLEFRFPGADQLQGARDAVAPERLERAPLELVVDHKKALHLIQKIRTQVAEDLTVLILMRADRNPDQPIISGGLAVLRLLCFHHAGQPRRNHVLRAG
jgi:hypothetical protein